ncbi:hypothetical protein VTK56DRAFT_881 [Thermocarpiscus australiensis]
MTGLASLPGEILLHILSFLDPPQITNLQLVSRGFRNLARDDGFWRLRCLQESAFLEALNRRRRFSRLATERDARQAAQVLLRGSAGGSSNGGSSSNGENSIGAGAGAALPLDGSEDGGGGGGGGDDDDMYDWPGSAAVASTLGLVASGAESRERERVRIMANWDPCFPSERVSWYDEYIQRHGPVAVNWLQFAYDRDMDREPVSSPEDFVEARGVALYYPDGGSDETILAVSPLDDGSVCLWDVGGTRGRRGAIVARSKPGILFVDGPGADNRSRSKRVDSGVTECVSVDSWHHRAFFAVQSHLIEVDLQRLSVVDCESYPWSITVLSAASPTVPLSVGTSFGIHLHDYRSRASLRDDAGETIDGFDRMASNFLYERGLRHIFDDEPLPPYAPLAQPGPLSILHLQKPGQEVDLSDDIYVAGRFSSILHYDRRKFPSIRGSIHSGARLCSMTSLPYPFSAVDNELRRKGELSLEQVEASKSAAGGRTLIACGEYNTKGSLEIYGISSNPPADTSAPAGLQNSTFKNRQTCSQSKLLSVVNHGARIAFSDGSGYIKWFERDGFTEVRRCRIGHCERAQGPSIFASMPGSDDIARKLLPTRPAGGHAAGCGRVNDNDLLFWTGDKLGLVTFSARPGFTAEDFEEHQALDPEQLRKERAYNEKMRRALERQADDVRFVRNLGLGSGILPPA